MNVFIIYQDDGYGDQVVDKVFVNKQPAINYVIDSLFKGNNFYKRQTRIENEKSAEGHIYSYSIDMTVK